MKKLKILIPIILLLFILPVWAQTEWTIGEDILTSNGNYFWESDADSVFASSDGDSLYIVGDDTLEIYINVGRTQGQINYIGYARGVAMLGAGGAKTCSLYFYISRHLGDGITRNDSIPETFYALDSVEVGANTKGTFEVYPLSNSTIDDRAVPYLTLRIYGVAGQVAKFWMREERVHAY